MNGAMQLALGGPVVIKSIGPVNLYLFGTAAAAGCVAGLAAAQWAGLAVAATAGLLLYAGRRRTAAELLAAAAWLEPWVPDWRSRSAAGRAVRAAAWAGGLLLLLALFRARL